MTCWSEELFKTMCAGAHSGAGNGKVPIQDVIDPGATRHFPVLVPLEETSRHGMVFISRFSLSVTDVSVSD